jgi:hypothetical protein
MRDKLADAFMGCQRRFQLNNVYSGWSGMLSGMDRNAVRYETESVFAIVRNTQVRRVPLRSAPKTLSADDVKAMLRRYDFFDNIWHKNGDFENDFVYHGDGTVTDRATGLTWQ